MNKKDKKKLETKRSTAIYTHAERDTHETVKRYGKRREVKNLCRTENITRMKKKTPRTHTRTQNILHTYAYIKTHLRENRNKSHHKAKGRAKKKKQ